MDQPPGAPPPATPGGDGPDWGEMKGKVTAAQGPDRILLVAGLLFVIATFLPWYRYKLIGRAFASDSAWGLGGLGVLAALFGLAAFGLTVAALLGVAKEVPAAVVLLLAGGALLFTFLRLVFEPGGDAARSIEILSEGALKTTRGIGLWAAFVLAIAMTFAAFQRFKASS